MIEIIKITEELKEKVINFWIEEGAFTRETANERVKECIFVALEDTKIIGVCSGAIMYVELLKDNFLYYRSYTKKDTRHSGIAKSLCNKTTEYFNKNRILNGVELKGVYIVFQNELLNKYITEYITSDTNLIFIGYNDKGQQMRVFYFEDSKFKQ